MPPTARHLHQAIPYPPVAMPAVRNVMGCGLGFSVGHRILDMEGSRIAMSDDLRTRIAAVLAEAQETHNGISDLALADAVIRELALIRDPFSTAAFHRYVTQWQPVLQRLRTTTPPRRMPTEGTT